MIDRDARLPEIRRDRWFAGEPLPPVSPMHCQRCGRVLLLEGPFPQGFDQASGEQIVGWEVRCPRQTRRSIVAFFSVDRQLHDHFNLTRWPQSDGTIGVHTMGAISWR